MADKKPGLLKRIFSFGFGRKKKEEVPEEIPAEVPEEVVAEVPEEVVVETAEEVVAEPAIETIAEQIGRAHV